MSDSQFNELLQLVSPRENNAFERHAQTALTSLIVLLLAGVATFVFRMSDNQDEQLIEIRVLQYQVKGLSDELRNGRGVLKEEIQSTKRSLDTIWPRLRAQSENISTLAREVEKLCKCTIHTKVPEKF